MPTDYGSDISDVPMEDGEIPSSAADSESAAVAHEPVTGSRRPREDDPSASSSKRSRNDDEEKAPTLVTPSSPRSALTERAPWMPSASEIARITAAQQRFETFSRRHMIDRFHNEAMEAGIPCAVRFGTACSHCLPGAERLSERDVTGYTTVRVPVQLRDLRAQLERRDTPSASGYRSARAGVTTAPRSGLRTPSPFLERPPSGRSAVPMYRGGEEILSNEYEDEPDLGSSSGVHSPPFARLSSESSRAHRAVGVAGAERYPSYGQPQVDRDSRALLDRVAALEQFQSGEFAQLQHELRYQKAQVAQVAQAASNIQVELGTQVVRLHDRVAALEKLVYAASSSSASHQG
ncbi:hypothetical protein Pcac1_g11292 [Phytophthora cactorum]|uniref:Uncharacterized protein n=1 Tax=Phytophthora cactorum TaxID=29920 RepID=A0A8T0Y5J0_9STRA|nr:hypothetical protein Pcac1_g11292 [Phytophthora cactorum]KAG2785889.1 hypothetical protein PC111_g24356 [Phytophthora cactorum]KAG2788653.1 hypothetical protein PC112_g24473 [Phytophthora cactorum]KAG2804477.1 hypothetical protein PC113_g24310 [Phytophthora cactorum]